MATTTGTFADAIAAQQTAWSDIWAIAQGVLNTLSVSSRNSSQPLLEENSALKYSPTTAPPNITLAAPIPIDNIIAKIDAYIVQLNQVKLPQFPTPPSMVMLNTSVWSDPLSDQIKSSLQGYITSMGLPDVSYQNAIFNKDYERNLQALNDLYDLADAKTGARGFNYPNDFGTALKLDAQQKYQFDRAEIGRNITRTLTEWAKQAYQFAVERGIGLEQMLSDFTYKYCTAGVQVYRDAVMALIEQLKAQITVLSEPVNLLIHELTAAYEYSKLKMEVDKANEVILEERAKIKISEALTKYGHDTSLLANEFSQQMQQYRSAAETSAQMAQAASTQILGYTNT